jgi:hypothetical protein
MDQLRAYVCAGVGFVLGLCLFKLESDKSLNRTFQGPDRKKSLIAAVLGAGAVIINIVILQ